MRVYYEHLPWRKSVAANGGVCVLWWWRSEGDGCGRSEGARETVDDTQALPLKIKVNFMKN